MSGIEHIPQSDELPPTTPEAVSIRIAISAFLAVTPKKRGDAFLREMARLYADEEGIANIMPIRPASQASTVQRARRLSLAWFRAILPALLAAVGRGGRI